MSTARGQMWVNPDGVVNVGRAYGEHSDTYARHVRAIHQLRNQYGEAWGDDETGREFSKKFLAGLDQLEALVGSVRGTLDYTSEGLTTGGRQYRAADDDARTAGYKMEQDFSDLSVPTGTVATARVTEGTPAEPMSRLTRSTRPATEAQPLLARTMSARTEAQPLLARTLATETEGRPPLAKTARLAVADSDGLPLEDAQLTPRISAALTPAIPAISSYVAKPEYTTALVDGRPLPEGYRLEALNPFANGTTRIDASLYDAVAPIGHTPVTNAEGRPLDPDGRQFFMVKDNPHADPTASGYRPMFLSFTADGSAAPLGPAY
ncbi:hypothetical protein [Actinoplanes awajinensis]|uniref:Uncharacterized protein n=1 Tax=Actinoplanes awajinensis subsp. mycoplanecinus TaxID=135947 RepID=A0A101J9H1_9ACTN|nr:hypothetical protein [Actinoplanes awajinensis]KUL22649.1 hypothetical protein ADL15_47700 [Actinoplanes awajinensis subsp. mycoplanecinus]